MKFYAATHIHTRTHVSTDENYNLSYTERLSEKKNIMSSTDNWLIRSKILTYVVVNKARLENIFKQDPVTDDWYFLEVLAPKRYSDGGKEE